MMSVRCTQRTLRKLGIKASYSDAGHIWIATRRRFGRGKIFLLALVMAGIVMTWMLTFMGALRMSNSLYGWIMIGLKMLLPLLLFLFAFRMLLQFLTRPAMLYVLRAEFGHNLCTRCGYSLRGLAGGESRCPECGTAVAEMPVCANAG